MGISSSALIHIISFHERILIVTHGVFSTRPLKSNRLNRKIISNFISGSLHILSLEHYLPVHDENGEFHIPYPSLSEMYVFNRYGQHIETKDMTSGLSRYRFLYSKNTSFGKLSTVADASGNKILFLRDYSNVVSIFDFMLNILYCGGQVPTPNIPCKEEQ